MRRRLPAFLVSALLLAAPASAQPSAPDCSALQEDAYKAEAEAARIADTLAALEMARSRLPLAEQAMSHSEARLESDIRLTNTVVELLRTPRADKSPEELRQRRLELMVLERYLTVLQEFRTLKAMGQTIDPRDNALVKWKRRIATGIPVLKAKVKGAKAAARGAQLAYDRCRLGRTAAAPKPSPSPAGKERIYRTNIGDVRIFIGPSSATGTYRVFRGPRVANGPGGPPPKPTVGQLKATRTGAVVTGYWFEPGDRLACPERDGFRTWGRFRWEFKGAGVFSGFRGDCDGPMSDTWDGAPGQ